MLEYVFTDKTGTLTRNEMVMKELIIGKKAYLTTNTSD
jgi:P-type E1-E2 ATPase